MSSPLKTNTETIQNLINQINALPDASSGVELPTLTNEGSASDLLSGKELIDSDGNVVIGTIATKTSSNLTASGATVTVPAGYYASNATKSVVTATQATPSITVNSSGLITTTATQTAGYVAAGTKSATYQLAFQAAKTITPTTTSQVAVSSGYYTGGNVMVAGDSNLVAENIKSGVSIFGVNGSLEEGSGGDVDDLVYGTLTTYTNDSITSIRNYAFYGCSSLTTISLPAVTSIGISAFCGCSSLTTASFPKATHIYVGAFASCTSLTTASFPKVTSIDGSAFASCTILTTISFPVAIFIGGYAFCSCSSLTTASFPKATHIYVGAFQGCYSLTTANFPVATYIDYRAFYGCYSLTTISFPKVTSIGSSAFYSCSSLTTANFPVCTTIRNYAFYSCIKLSKIYLMASSVCKLSNSNAFSDTSI